MGHSNTTPPDATVQNAAPLGDTERVRVLLEEFRALYALLLFRLAAVERSLPVAGGPLAAILSGSTSLAHEAQRVVLLAMPAARTRRQPNGRNCVYFRG